MIQGTLGIGGHTRPHRGITDDWLTPPHLIDTLGPFDMDPCCPPNMPWQTAATMLTEADDGLTADWTGLVWCNPPYGPEVGNWLQRLAGHKDGGIALIFARTETATFQQWAFGRADLILFLAGRLHFHHVDGSRAAGNAGGPSAIVAYGDEASRRIRQAVANKHVAGAVWTPETAIEHPYDARLRAAQKCDPRSGNCRVATETYIGGSDGR